MQGIYYIKCKLNNKVYIGSSINIKERLYKHFWQLKNNRHKNQYLQNIFNKYGIDSLKKGIIMLCSKDKLKKLEQFFIDNNKNLINIIKEDVTRPSLSKEVRLKISETLLRKHKEGKITSNSGQFKKGHVPWQKGKKYKSTEHLKVPKRNTELRRQSRINIKEKRREEVFPEVKVYKDNKYICTYRCSKDLYEDSLKKNFKLIPFMTLRNKKGRNGLSPYVLQTCNINKSSKTNKPYKGLSFQLKCPSI